MMYAFYIKPLELEISVYASNPDEAAKRAKEEYAVALQDLTEEDIIKYLL